MNPTLIGDRLFSLIEILTFPFWSCCASWTANGTSSPTKIVAGLLSRIVSVGSWTMRLLSSSLTSRRKAWTSVKSRTAMGFGFPKDDRPALVASDPERFFMPRPSDMRFHWVETRLDRLELDEMHEFVLDAWGMVVPKFLFRDRLRKMGLTEGSDVPK